MFFNSSLFSLFTLGSSNQVPPHSRPIYVQILAFWHCLAKEQMLQHLCFLASTYRNVASSNTSHIEALAGFFILTMKGILMITYCDLLEKTLFLH
jgi:hypothetical protein